MHVITASYFLYCVNTYNDNASTLTAIHMSRKKFTGVDIVKIIEKEGDDSLRPLWVLLHDMWYLKYSKINEYNYTYWRCETEDIKKAKKKIYTYSIHNLEKTRKTKFIYKFSDLNKSYSSEKIINTVNDIILRIQDFSCFSYYNNTKGTLFW